MNKQEIHKAIQFAKEQGRKEAYNYFFHGFKKPIIVEEEDYFSMEEAQKMFLEEIKSMRKHKDTKLIHNFDGEEIDYLISAKELKSKIGGEDDA